MNTNTEKTVGVSSVTDMLAAHNEILVAQREPIGTIWVQEYVKPGTVRNIDIHPFYEGDDMLNPSIQITYIEEKPSAVHDGSEKFTTITINPGDNGSVVVENDEGKSEEEARKVMDAALNGLCLIAAAGSTEPYTDGIFEKFRLRHVEDQLKPDSRVEEKNNPVAEVVNLARKIEAETMMSDTDFLPFAQIALGKAVSQGK